jgi:cytochrome c2
MNKQAPGAEEKLCPFYPNHIFVEALTALVVLAALAVLALVFQTPLEEMDNPADTTYIPRQEWYFLFYSQLLKYFEGGLTVVGVFVLPLAAFILVLLLPFYDRRQVSSLRKRPVAAALGLIGVLCFSGLTAQAMLEDADNPRIRRMYLPPIQEEQIARGRKSFETFCMLCHSMDGKGGFMATELAQIGGRASRSYIENVIMNPQIVSDKTIMSLIPLSDEERHEVSAFLSTKKE